MASNDGAKGIYRASPNFMVVVPTSKHVNIEMKRDFVEWVSLALFLFSILLLIYIKKDKPIKQYKLPMRK